jgi:hypothetical protein
MTMVIVLHRDCTVCSSSLGNSCHGADPSLHGCCTRLACVQAGGLPSRTAVFLLKTYADTKKNRKEHEREEEEGFFPHFCRVPNVFPLSSQCVPQTVLHSTSLLSHCFWQMLSSFHTCIMWAKGKELYTSK